MARSCDIRVLGSGVGLGTVLVEPIDELLDEADLGEALLEGLLVMAWDPVAAGDFPAGAAGTRPDVEAGSSQ